MADTADTEMVPCVALEGFKLGRALITPGQSVRLRREEYEPLKRAGAVADPEAARQSEEQAAALRLVMLTEFFGRPPTLREVEEVERLPLDRLAESLAAQRQAQAEWEEAQRERDARREAHERAKGEADAQRHTKGLERSRRRAGG